MVALVWDAVGTRYYETGVSKGVLYKPTAGVYDAGFAWSGLVTVTESPTGAEANPQYADNMKYLNLYSAEEFAATIEALTYPDEFAEHDGLAEPVPGVTIGQQNRKPFGFCYRTEVGNDTEGLDAGYKLHLVYGAMASPTERVNSTINESPEAPTMSWEITTTGVAVTGHKPTAKLTVDSRTVTPAKMAELEALLYGDATNEPSLPLPDAVIALIEAA